MSQAFEMASSSLQETIVVEDDASIQDIMNVILEVYQESIEQTKRYSENFDFSSKSGFKELWTDIKQSVRYKADEPGIEIVKSPSALYSIGRGDCKSFTIAGCSTMYNGGVKKMVMRLCHYGNPSEAHIYPIAYLNGRRIIMDSVHHTFNQEAPGKVWYIDYDPNSGRVIREVGIRSKATNDLMQKLYNTGVVIGGIKLLSSDNIFFKMIGIGILLYKGRNYMINNLEA